MFSIINIINTAVIIWASLVAQMVTPLIPYISALGMIFKENIKGRPDQ